MPSGTGAGQTDGPWGLDFDANGNLYVVDRAASRILKFDAAGTFLSTWGSKGTSPGQFHYPTGITVDSAGSVYVSDTFNRIQKFTYNVPVTPTTWGRLKRLFP